MDRVTPSGSKVRELVLLKPGIAEGSWFDLGHVRNFTLKVSGIQAGQRVVVAGLFWAREGTPAIEHPADGWLSITADGWETYQAGRPPELNAQGVGHGMPDPVRWMRAEVEGPGPGVWVEVVGW